MPKLLKLNRVLFLSIVGEVFAALLAATEELIGMETDRENFAHDETLLARRPWYVLAAALLLLSAVAHQPLAFLAALFALVIGLVPEIWYRSALRHLRIRQQVSAPRAFVGETLTLAISVDNPKLLPLPWLEIEDEIPEQ